MPRDGGDATACRQATGAPDASSPAASRCSEIGWKSPTRRSSWRVQRILTGARTARDASTASMTKSDRPRRPNPPPSSVTLTITAEGSSPSAFAIASCAPFGFCVPAQTSQRPGFTSATALIGSSGVCAWYG